MPWLPAKISIMYIYICILYNITNNDDINNNDNNDDNNNDNNI